MGMIWVFWFYKPFLFGSALYADTVDQKVVYNYPEPSAALYNQHILQYPNTSLSHAPNGPKKLCVIKN